MSPGATIRPAVKAVVTRDDEVLLLHHWFLESDFYELPGGGQRHGERLFDALVREVWEETGVEVVPGQLLFVRDYISTNHQFSAVEGGRHQIELVFSCTPTGLTVPDPPVPDDFQIGVVWVPRAALPSMPMFPAAYRSLVATSSTPNGRAIYLGDVN